MCYIKKITVSLHEFEYNVDCTSTISDCFVIVWSEQQQNPEHSDQNIEYGPILLKLDVLLLQNLTHKYQSAQTPL